MRRLLPLALALLACNAGFDPQYRVTDLRILAVRTQAEGTYHADVAEGELLRLAALVANPLGPPDPVVSWYACAPLGSDPAHVPPCRDADFLRDPVGLATDPRFQGDVALIANGAAPGPIPIPDVHPGAVHAALQAAEAAAASSAAWVCRPYVEIPLVVVAERDGRSEVAEDLVRVVPPPELLYEYVRNDNPDVADVRRAPDDEDACTGGTTVGGAEPFPEGRTVVCGKPAVGSQLFHQCTDAGPYDTAESLSWQWYVTAGTFPEFGGRGNAVGGAVEFERPAEAFTLWGILRDGRGGVAWTARSVSP